MDHMMASALVVLGSTLFLLGTGMWVSLTLLAVGMITLGVLSPAPMGSLVASTLWDASWGWALTSLPLFIWMGEILFRTNLASAMFTGLAPWLGRLPGGLLHVNILGCGTLAAVTGSSAVTCATIGRLSVPELQARGYPEKMTIGSLAGSGTLGLLIPPSIIMIVYGVTAEQSIAKLFMAGVLPAVVLIVLYMVYTGGWALANKDQMPPPEPAMPFLARVRASLSLIPVGCLIVFVLGAIYGGFATPTEAAAFGVIGSLVLAAFSRTLTLRNLVDGMMAAMRTSCMISMIIACAACLSIGVAFLDLPGALAGWVRSFGLSPHALLLVLALVILVMGCFLEGISIIVLTSSVMLPMVQGAGIDMIWFGIFLVILIEAAQITPPVGFNLFVLQSITGRDIIRVTIATIPYFLLLLVLLVVITIFPQIVLVLPQNL